MTGDRNINSFNYGNNELVKKNFNPIFQNRFLPLIQRATRVREQQQLQLTTS